MNLVYGRDDIFVPWICTQLFINNPGLCTSIGLVKDNKIIGAALYNGYQLTTDKKPLLIEMSFATIDRSWCTRANIYALLSYPFSQLRVRRVQVTVSRRNRTVRSFLINLGFRYEGTGRQAWPAGGDACVYSLLSREFFASKWNINNGQKRSISSSSS